MLTKHVLLLGDEEKEMFKLFPKDSIVEVVVNFQQSPSVGVLIEQTAMEAQNTSEKAREIGCKAGVYASHDKGVLWLYKTMNLQGGKDG